MVKLQIKRGEENLFLYETLCSVGINQLIEELIIIYNLSLKIERIADEMNDLASHGVSLPINMQGLTEEQIVELKLKDEWGAKCIPMGGPELNKDPIGRRNGQAPNAKMKEVIKRTVQDAKNIISNKQVVAGICLTLEMLNEAILQLKGAMMIVYPMGLPPYEPVELEFRGEEDLSGTQASKLVLLSGQCALWWAGKELQHSKIMRDYVGTNEKTKIVCKLLKQGSGAPSREPQFTGAEQTMMLSQAHKRSEELKSLETVDDDHYLQSEWMDDKKLQKTLQGLSDVKLGQRK